jgi:general secretion pathway protein L
MKAVLAFLRWWGEQLADWLPEGVRHRLTARRTVLTLACADSHCTIHLQHAGREQLLGAYPDMDANGLRLALRQHPPVQGIALKLSPADYLLRTVELPLAAAEDLSQAIGYQVESLTPFKREQLWLFCGEQERLPDGKRLRAWMVAVPRRAAQALQALGLQSSDTPVRGPRQAPAAGAPLLLGFRPGKLGSGLPLGGLLMALNLAALLLAVGLHLDKRQAELASLKSQNRALQQQAVAASDLARQTEQLQQRLDSLRQKRTDTPTAVAVLEEVSRRLDDQTWLQRLALRQQQLRLQGSSNNASALIAQLDGSPLFGDVQFDASLTRDPAGGGERFNLAGQVNPNGSANTADRDPVNQP